MIATRPSTITFSIIGTVAAGRVNVERLVDVADATASVIQGVDQFGDVIELDRETGALSLASGAGTLTGSGAAVRWFGGTAADETRWMKDRAYWRGIQARTWPITGLAG